MRLDLTAGEDTFTTETVASFRCSEPGASTFIEFIGPAIEHAMLNGKSLPPSAFDGGRLHLEGLAAENRLEVTAIARYMRDGTGLHRFRDPVDGRHYLHSQFEANDAHRVYTCFDQPDLKATFELAVTAPDGWVVVSNTTPATSDDGEWVFPPTRPISTYITAIVTGEYASWHEDHGGIPMGLYCRQSLAQYLDTPEIFEITRQGLDFFAMRFGHPYPFGKFDQLFVPEFSAGAMENAACVTHSERMVYRSRVTEGTRLSRAETILHEMAHMWFGDLVTMRWFDDLWLNESFATYTSYVALVEATRFKSAWLDFASKMKAMAKAQDQLPTTHPIVADIPDVEAVHLNFDAITYEKGASVLKQLAAWLGEEAFFKGIATYLARHAWRNAELHDFLHSLEEASGRDLKSWSQLWLETAGVNTIGAELQLDGRKIARAELHQTAPTTHPTLRPHRLRVGLYDKDGPVLRRRSAVELDIEGAVTPIPQLTGQPAPDLLLVNDDDLAYTKLHFDAHSVETLRGSLRAIEDPLARAVSWGALWDMVRDAHLRAREYVATALDNIDVEDDAALAHALLSRIDSAIEVYGDPSNRVHTRATLANAARARTVDSTRGRDLQLLWTRAFIDAARSADDVAWVRGLLDGATRVEGLKVDFAIRWAGVIALARIGAAGAEVIAAELQRDPTEEGRRAAATARAAQPMAEAKAEAWTTIRDGADVSLAMRRAFAAGFQHADQADLLQPYVQRYFDELLPFWESHDIDEGLMFVDSLYPSTIVSPEVIELVDEMLGRDLPGPVRRALLEAQDSTARELRARGFDASGGEPQAFRP